MNQPMMKRFFSGVRYLPSFSFFKKGSFASFKMLSPTWKEVTLKDDSEIRNIEKNGALLLSITPNVDGKYVYAQHLNISLAPTDLASIVCTKPLPDSGLSFHRQIEDVTKLLSVKHSKDKYFFNLKVNDQSVTSFLQEDEMQTLRLMAPSIINHCYGFDKLLM